MRMIRQGACVPQEMISVTKSEHPSLPISSPRRGGSAALDRCYSHSSHTQSIKARLENVILFSPLPVFLEQRRIYLTEVRLRGDGAGAVGRLQGV